MDPRASAAAGAWRLRRIASTGMGKGTRDSGSGGRGRDGAGRTVQGPGEPSGPLPAPVLSVLCSVHEFTPVLTACPQLLPKKPSAPKSGSAALRQEPELRIPTPISDSGWEGALGMSGPDTWEVLTKCSYHPSAIASSMTYLPQHPLRHPLCHHSTVSSSITSASSAISPAGPRALRGGGWTPTAGAGRESGLQSICASLVPSQLPRK